MANQIFDVVAKDTWQQTGRYTLADSTVSRVLWQIREYTVVTLVTNFSNKSYIVKTNTC